MLYAVTDIETTGGYAAENAITEIGVVVTDGVEIKDTFYAMLNPGMEIPPFIESLTGITNELVRDLPAFETISSELYDLLQDKVFVAHNVNFDYSFIKYHLAKNGFHLNVHKLDTIRLSRHFVPGLKGYGLDKLCQSLKIKITGRHSALGDAMAATEILHLMIVRDNEKYIQQQLKEQGRDVSLPPNVNRDAVEALPGKPGVYYFHSHDGKIIYVGKAKNIRKRVKGHFTNNKAGKQKQEFLKKVYSISYQETATELMARILEDFEIKKIWPEQNSAQKWNERRFGLYSYFDSAGFQRLFIDKENKRLKPVCSFTTLTEGISFLRKCIEEFELCPYLCFLIKKKEDCSSGDFHCHGACCGNEKPNVYNLRIEKCLEGISERLPSMAILDRGIQSGQKSCILVEKGRFVGMGCYSEKIKDIVKIKESITRYSDNSFARSIIYKYAESHPYHTFSF